MSEAETQTVDTRTRVILPHPTSGQALLVRGEHGWALPFVDTPPHKPRHLAGTVARACAEQLGVAVTALRCARVRSDGNDNANTVVVLENHDHTWRPPAGARWADLSDARRLLTEDAAGRAALLHWFGEGGRAAAPPLRPPWAHPGWYQRAVAWAEGELTRLGRRPTGHIEQVKLWCISSILRIETTAGDAWFKAVPGFFAHEGRLIQLLTPSLPASLPTVLALGPERGWLLLDTIPGEKLRAGRDEAKMAEALRVLARLQQEWTSRTDELLSIGCPDRRLATLDGELERLLARPEVRGDLGDGEITKLKAFAREIPERRVALAACGVPETIVHGDFDPGNVSVDGDGLVLFDWTDGCVGHPFVDLATFLERDGEANTNAAFRAAYLEVWSQTVPEARLEEAMALAAPFACLHHAISYQRIVDAVEPAERWEFAGATQKWLRRILASEADRAP